MNQHILSSQLDHPAYHATVRLPRYNGKVSVFRALSSDDGAKVLRRVNPGWTQEDHRVLAQRHAEESAKQQALYNKLLDEAANETFGRPFRVTDYRISAIACDEFSESKKEALRKAAHSRTHHEIVAGAHLRASRFRQSSR